MPAGVLCAATATTPAAAADWSDTSLSYRHGSKFREPFNPENISKNIFALTHVSGYKYGINFFNVDALMSDKKDPANANSTEGAQEAYIVYRHTLDIGKIMKSEYKFGPMRGLGATAGFGWRAESDAGYKPQKAQAVLWSTAVFCVRCVFKPSPLAV